MHVVTITANDITSDTRVKRQALALARAGLRTTVVSRAAEDVRIGALGRAITVKVPVAPDVQGFLRSVREHRRSWRPLPRWLADPRSRELYERRRSWRERADEVRPGQTLVSRGWRRARRTSSAAALASADWIDARIAAGWRLLDERLPSSTVGVRWRRTLDGLVDDLELAMGPVLDALAPDVVHVHDMHVLPVAVHAARRAAVTGRRVAVVYDAHEYVAGLAVAGAFTPRSIAAWADLEAEFAPLADRVIAVSPGSADAIQRRLELPRRPEVVYNVPVPDAEPGAVPGLRDVCGLDEGVPLVVYAGRVRGVRGIDTAIDALQDLPAVHLAVVCVPDTTSRAVAGMQEHARSRGVADRVHFLEGVPPAKVVHFLSSADVGLIPMQGGWLNHELTLPNKLFEYLVAGVPVVASDLVGLGAFVREHGVGQTFPPGDAQLLAGAIRDVLDDRDDYTAAVGSYDVQEIASWRSQERVLHRVYAEVLGKDAVRPVGDQAGVSLEERPVRRLSPGSGEGRLLAIGPLNANGRAAALAGAVRKLPDVDVESLRVVRRGQDESVDAVVTRVTFRWDVAWQTRQLRHLLQDVTHVLSEDGLPLAGGDPRGDHVAQAAMLADAGVRLGFWVSPSFPSDAAERLHRWRSELTADVFVPDPALLERIPEATWLPPVVDGPLASDVLWDGQRMPVVAALRPSPETISALEALEREGLLTYRRSAETTADFVVQDLRTRMLSEGSLTAMARGAIAVGASVGPAPVLHSSAGELREVLEQAIREPAGALERGREGLEYVREVHDGRRSAAVLAPFLGVTATDAGLDWAAAGADRGDA